MSELKVVQPLLDFCLDNPKRVISIEVTDAQAKEGVVKVMVVITNTIIITILIITNHLDPDNFCNFDCCHQHHHHVFIVFIIFLITITSLIL